MTVPIGENLTDESAAHAWTVTVAYQRRTQVCAVRTARSVNKIENKQATFADLKTERIKTYATRL